MRSLISLALGLLGASALVSAADAESAVTQLNKDTFDDFIKQHDLVLAEFFAPWCGHCKALAPEYEKAATELKEKNIPLVKVDCTEETELCRQYEVQGYPTLKVFRGLDSIKPYPGARKADALVSYMIKQSLPAVSPVTQENLEEFKGMDKVVIVSYVASGEKQAETFKEIAEAERDNFLFGASEDAALAEAEGVKQPAIVLYKTFDEGKAVYDGEWKTEDILEWITTQSTPLVGEIGPETYAKYIKSGKPLAYIFAETPEEREQLAKDFKPIAEKHRGKLNIVTIDAKAFGAHADNLNLDPTKFPAFAIQDVKNNNKFPWDQSKKVEADAIAPFVQDVLDGKVAPSVKSQPIPETQDGPVTVVVAHTYQELVIDNDKDVLLEFYAPWCGHCRALAPKYDQLGQIFRDNPEYSSKVTIAKIDATANDVPDRITGFPTIKLFPAGAKDSPVEYSGPRTVADLARFIKEKGKHGVDAVAEAEAAAESASSSTSSSTSSSSTSTSSTSSEGESSTSTAETAESATPQSAGEEEAEEKTAEHDEL